jgi:hypothetical protein
VGVRLIVEFAAKHNIAVLPGALTPTEVVTAWSGRATPLFWGRDHKLRVNFVCLRQSLPHPRLVSRLVERGSKTVKGSASSQNSINCRQQGNTRERFLDQYEIVCQWHLLCQCFPSVSRHEDDLDVRSQCL